MTRNVLSAAAALLLCLPAVGESQTLYVGSDRCMACHNGLSTAPGSDMSIGFEWRPGMMANSARDPYWQASVRREIMDHPAGRAAIEEECSTCHMPMSHREEQAAGHEARIFANLPAAAGRPGNPLAVDGVSCAACHRISSQKLGSRETFVGRFLTAPANGAGEAPAYGPFAVDAGRARIMRSASGFQPTEGKHIRDSALCASCHTLYTSALGPDGKAIGRLPEQVPYLEWLHSGYKDRRSCQDCHMRKIEGEAAISAVMGTPRAGLSHHDFTGGNFFVEKILNRFRAELGTVALPQETEASVARTLEKLQGEAARLSIERIEQRAGRLEAEISIENLGGHKLPTAYPSRRTWLHVVVRDRDGRAVFESGALDARGAIQGNDNDADPVRYEPHYTAITESGQVQVYESIMADSAGTPTTGLLKGVRYLKDNRLLPQGFDKRTAEKDIAVMGEAAGDEDFTGGSDRVRYSVELGEARGPFRLEAELWYQPISFRWASNLRTYDAEEPRRFVRYYDAMAQASGVILARVCGATAPGSGRCTGP